MTNNPDMQPTVTEALKPCPFCGSDAMRLIEVSPLHEGKFRVSHDHAITGFDCYVSGPIRVGEAAAIAAWNTRHRSQDTARSADVGREALEGWAEISGDAKAIVACGDRWKAVAAKIGCGLHGFNDGKSASFVTPDGNIIEVGPKFRLTIAALTTPP